MAIRPVWTLARRLAYTRRPRTRRALTLPRTAETKRTLQPPRRRWGSFMHVTRALRAGGAGVLGLAGGALAPPAGSPAGSGALWAGALHGALPESVSEPPASGTNFQS